MKKTICRTGIFVLTVLSAMILFGNIFASVTYAKEATVSLDGTPIGDELASVLKESRKVDEDIQSPKVTQVEMNELAAEQYRLWDDELKSIWERITLYAPEKELEIYRAEQSKWNLDRKTAMKKAGLEFAGGSMQSMVESGEGAQMTQERVYALAQILANYMTKVTEYKLSEAVSLKSSDGVKVDTDKIIPHISNEMGGRYDGNTYTYPIRSGKGYITVGSDNVAKLTRYQSGTGDTLFDPVMKQYGYNDYKINVYYAGPDTKYEELTDGPICINLVIEQGEYDYYFNDGIYLARGVFNPEKETYSRTYLQKANDFIKSLYNIGWKIEPINNDKILGDITKKLSSKQESLGESSRIDGLEGILGKDIYHVIEKLGPLPKGYSKDAGWHDYSAEWPDRKILVIFSTYDDSAFMIYAKADCVWDIAKGGEDPKAICKRLHGEGFEMYKEEALGDYWVGAEVGDPCARFYVGDTYYYIALGQGGKVMPDSEVMIN